MIRTVLAVATLAVMALLGASAASVIYSLMGTYGSQTGSDVDSFLAILPMVLIGAGFLGLVGMVAVNLAPQSRRLAVKIAACVIVALSVGAMLVANHYGNEAFQSSEEEAVAPPP